MKKIISVLICIILCICTCVPIYAQAAECADIINLNDSEISSNLVLNNSFEFGKPEAFWKFRNMDYEIDNDYPMNQNNTHYIKLSAKEKGTISALGYNTNNEKPKANMRFAEGEKYDFSCYIRNINFDGTIYVYLNSKSNKHVVTELDISNSQMNWKQISCELESLATETGSLSIELNGTGAIWLDFVQLIPHSAYGYGKEQYKYSTIHPEAQKEIANSSEEYVEKAFNNADDWKKAIGPIEERQDDDYLSSQIGIIEYLNLCEETGKEFLPTFYGYNIPVQDILDLIEFANGDSVKTYWGALRAANGHPEPYNINAIGVCNGDAAKIQSVLNESHSDITVVEVPSNCEPSPLQFLLNSQPNTDYTQTILLITAPCAAVLAIAVIIIVLAKKRK